MNNMSMTGETIPSETPGVKQVLSRRIGLPLNAQNANSSWKSITDIYKK